jgi:hypothetical protein
LKSKNTTYLINYPSDVPCEIKNIKVAISYLTLSDTVCLRFKCKSNKFKIKINKN